MSRTRTIGIVVPSFEDTGGVISVAEFLCRTIARQPSLNVRVISLATSSRDPCNLLLSNPSTWLRGVTIRAGHCHGQTFTHVGAQFGEFEFCRLAKRRRLSELLEGCDIIQVVAGVPAWACPVLGLNKPVVLQAATLVAVERKARSRESLGVLAMWRSMMTKIVSRFDLTALRQVDAIMVENPWMLKHAEHVNQGRQTIVRYAPPGVDSAFFRPVNEHAAIPPRPYVLAVGRFSDVRKNPLLLLEAYVLMLRSVKEAPDLTLCGTDPPPRFFWTRAAEYGITDRISFVQNPPNEELASLYRNAICLALPSDEEGFGIVVVEAMSSGVPAVATRCGGPDGIITDGVDGYLVECGNAVQMADRLTSFAVDPLSAQSMGRKARATVERRYADRISGDSYLDVYDRLLRKP